VEDLRSRPIVEMFVGLETMVNRIYFDRKKISQKGGPYSQGCIKFLDQFEKTLSGKSHSFHLNAYGGLNFTVAVTNRGNQGTILFCVSTAIQTNLEEPGNLTEPEKDKNSIKGWCDCGYPALYGFPCIHLYFVLREKNITLDDYIDKVWHSNLYKMSYDDIPIVQTQGLTLMRYCSTHHVPVVPPNYTKRIGRPKKKRLPSQVELEEVTAPIGKGHMQKKCPSIAQ
jgi:hypothetical protein